MTKARTIIETARAIVAGDLDLEGLERLDDPAAVGRLTSLRGIGRWTAEYVLLRGLGRLHVFPATTSAPTTSSGAYSTSTRRWTTSPPPLVARWHPYAGVVFLHLLLDCCPGRARAMHSHEACGPSDTPRTPLTRCGVAHRARHHAGGGHRYACRDLGAIRSSTPARSREACRSAGGIHAFAAPWRLAGGERGLPNDGGGTCHFVGTPTTRWVENSRTVSRSYAGSPRGDVPP